MMKLKTLTGSGALLLALAACNPNETVADAETIAETTEAQRLVHSARGEVTEVSDYGITIAHGPIDSLGWPAMTMTFMASSPRLLAGAAVGEEVEFDFWEVADGYEVIGIAGIRAPGSPNQAVEQ